MVFTNLNGNKLFNNQESLGLNMVMFQEWEVVQIAQDQEALEDLIADARE